MTRSLDDDTSVYRDPLGAWEALREHGGLEPEGRDCELLDSLRVYLSPSAPNLEAALRCASMRAFLEGLFLMVQPFVEMFRDILLFFETAGATDGRQQLNLQVDEVDLDLDHFRRFLKLWNEVEADLMAPLVDQETAWLLPKLTRDLPEMEGAHGFGDQLTGIRDVDQWLTAYRAGRYEPFPQTLLPTNVLEGYAAIAAVAVAAQSIIMQRTTLKEELIAPWREIGFQGDGSHALTPLSIAQNETDYWLGTIVMCLASLPRISTDARKAIASELEHELQRFPLAKFTARVNVTDLLSVLSLPIWNKRHELYAVWIATQIIDAIREHDLEIHHDNGRIVFAFRETTVATIRSAFPQVRLISERRVPLLSPIGKGRTGNVQPDYGLWRSVARGETCGLVVEVKHYKRSARRSFSEVLTDYAHAFADAKILLVNYGPIGSITPHLPRDVSARCNTIQFLTPENVTARDKLSKAVRDYVGTSRTQFPVDETIIAVDVSPSMMPYVRSFGFEAILRDLAGGAAGDIALIDTKIRTIIPLRDIAVTIEGITGDGTALSAPTAELLQKYKRVVVVTDADGARDLVGLSVRVIDSPQPELVLLDVERAKNS